jgi:hypothetical protein
MVVVMKRKKGKERGQASVEHKGRSFRSGCFNGANAHQKSSNQRCMRRLARNQRDLCLSLSLSFSPRVCAGKVRGPTVTAVASGLPQSFLLLWRKVCWTQSRQSMLTCTACTLSNAFHCQTTFLLPSVVARLFLPVPARHQCATPGTNRQRLAHAGTITLIALCHTSRPR